jgi:hypothetical protein
MQHLTYLIWDFAELELVRDSQRNEAWTEQNLNHREQVASFLQRATRQYGPGGRTALHSARTAIAAMLSLTVARLFRLPEAYSAPITTSVITQSSLDAAFAVSGERFAGTNLGAAVGAIVASDLAQFFCVRRERFHPRSSHSRTALQSECLSIRWRYSRDRAAVALERTSVARRVLSVCGRVYRARCGFDADSGLARAGGDSIRKSAKS